MHFSLLEGTEPHLFLSSISLIHPAFYNWAFLSGSLSWRHCSVSLPCPCPFCTLGRGLAPWFLFWFAWEAGDFLKHRAYSTKAKENPGALGHVGLLY